MTIVRYAIGKASAELVCYIHDDLSQVGGSYRLRPAVIVFPGGGYNHLSPREADPAALPVFAHGYNAFIMRYSVGDDAGTGTDDPEQPAEGDGEGEQSFFDEHGYLFIVFIVLAAVCVFAYVGPFHIQHPLVIIAAVICAILAVLTFVYVDFGGIADAIGDLFNSEE